MPLSRAQVDALISIYKDASGFPGISIRKPTVEALLRMRFIYAESYENDKAVGTMYKLTPVGRKVTEDHLRIRAHPALEEDLMENWESYT